MTESRLWLVQSLIGSLHVNGLSQLGTSKFAHHFGLTRFSNLGEQLIRQDSVTHSIKTPVFRSLAPLAADLAAGVRLRGGS